MVMQLVEWRRKLHANPELSFQEVETSRMVARILENIPGMHVQRDVGYPTAVVGTLSSGEGPTFAIRADMDALPIQEENTHDYRSQNQGVMHACGHDAHTAIGLGTAHLLSEYFQNREIQGTIKFLFQPAEERADEHGSTGAPYMIQAGVLDDVDTVIALHMSPEHSVGEVLVHDGYSMANVDVFEAKIFGTGGHGAYPHQGTDPIWMLSPVLDAVYGITARRVSPLESAVISIGSIHSGSASNVLPSEIEIKGTIRSYNPDVRKIMHAELEKAFSIVKVWNGDYRLKISCEDPALENDPGINRFIDRTIRDLYPDFYIRNTPFGLGGEDFAHMTEKVPGAMFFLGCAIDDRASSPRNLHTPTFDIDEKVLPIGVCIIAETAKRYLMKEEAEGV
ncbi:amidohydrolase [Virgibacillus sp. NKC19-16]|uniref:M20 metallopeptidase family protein n=1 Tax=Virgibacillus salidurans TaxID=2831673 RepID=UPI001F181144|nr:M20 family metallopeptidase [Virgibacillus sp. NKC19-16]UJL48203.1 amidohydrolase [Virgibacillus sp. NKC19-16]